MYNNVFLNKKGFAVSSILYPAFIIIITITVLITLIQSSFSIGKLTTELQGDMSDDNTMKSLKDSSEMVLKDSKGKISWSGDADGKINMYNVTQGSIKLVNQSGKEVDSDLKTEANTTNWKGRFFISQMVLNFF